MHCLPGSGPKLERLANMITGFSKSWRVAAFGVLMIAIWLAPIRQGQAEETGREVFEENCAVCHTIGKGKLIGPDLSGVTSRREAGWLIRQIKEPEKLNETLTKMSDEFIGAVRSTLKLADQSVVWFSGNQLMVVGDAATHAKVDDLLRNLADPSYKPGKELAQLHKRCSARATSRHESAKQARLAERQAHVASVHQQFSWPLLSAASRGDLDLEALTELQITWKDTASVELLTGKSGLLMLRSLWTVCEASRLLPDETELVALANEIKRIAREPAKETVVKFSGSQHQPDALAIFYAALVFNDPDGEFVKRARMVQQSEHRWTANLAEVLFGNGVPDEGLFFEKMTGEDAVLLSALACRRADGDAYNKFRSQSRRILGQQPLNGHVVVLVNRLATPFPSVQ